MKCCAVRTACAATCCVLFKKNTPCKKPNFNKPNMAVKILNWATYCGVALGVGSRGASLVVLSRGFSGSSARPQPLRRSLSGYTLSERRGFPFHAPRVRLLQEF